MFMMFVVPTPLGEAMLVAAKWPYHDEGPVRGPSSFSEP